MGKLKGKACWYCEWISFILPSRSTDQRAPQVVLVLIEAGGDRKGPMFFYLSYIENQDALILKIFSEKYSKGIR